MPLEVKIVTRRARNTAELSPSLVPGARMLAEFRRSGLLTRVGAFHLDRRSGACDVLSFFTFAVTFFLAGPHHALQKFCDMFRRDLRRIARLADLPKLPSGGALSRGLAAVDRTTAEAVSDALLVQESAMMALLNHPSVLHHDSLGNPWHVTDFDPSIRAFRLRELPEGDDLGPATRRVPGVPGYTGHKRGETRIRHLPLMHAGAGLWLAYRLEVPGDVGVRSFKKVLIAARPWWVRLGPEAQCVVRFDGELGHTGGFRACRDEGIHAIGRLSRYTLLERPEIQKALQAAHWRAVSCPGAAKPTEAADLGWVTLHPAEGAEDAEGGPVEVRLVVSRLRPTEGRLRHGVLIDGYQIELFGTTLPPEAWPADEIVVLYRGRAILENRFAQEDREFATERTFSYHLGGQMLMVSFAMAIWNHLIHQAFLANPPPKVSPGQAPRPPAPEVAPPPLVLPVPTPPASVSPASVTDAAEPQNLPCEAGSSPTPSLPEVSDVASAATASPPSASLPEAPDAANIVTAPPGADPPAAEPPSTPRPACPSSKLAAVLATYFHDVTTQPGWKLDPEGGILTCPGLTPFNLRYVDQSKKGYHRVVAGNPQGACNGCPFRSSCFGSTRTDASKRIARSVPAQVAVEVAEALALERLPVAPRPPRPRDRAHADEPPPPSILRPHAEHQPGEWRASFPSFLPAKARQRAREALEGRATLRVRRRPPPRTSHPLIENDRAARQHQRRQRQRPTGQIHAVLRIVAVRAGSEGHWRCD